MEWFDFSFRDVIDILLVVFLIYQIYRLVKGTVALNILIGLGLIYLLWRIVTLLQLDMLSTILGQFIGVGIIAVIVIFQPEIRRFLIQLGTTKFSEKGFRIFKNRAVKADQYRNVRVEAIADAAFTMAKTYTGALIVLKRSTNIYKNISGGEKQHIQVTSSILESIFFKNSPLHDGAVVIEDGNIVLAGAILPVYEDKNLLKMYGMRHRAALGVCEKSDAVCVVVSEERGEVALVKGTTIRVMPDKEEFIDALMDEFLL